jgi:hypothetical protein
MVLLMKKFYIISCHVLWREICHFAAISKNSFNFHFLKQGLHNTPDILRKQVQAAIDAVDDEYDAILIGYGLCSNGLVDIQARDKKLVIMRGHDCITFLLGSKQRYQQYFDQHPGTYWYSPGWIDTTLMPSRERLDQIFQQYREKYGEENADYLMQIEQRWIHDYSTAAYVDLGFYDTERYQEFSKKCAEELAWSYDEQVGDPHLIINFLEGTWNTDDFLVVQPGEKVVASHDERIIEVWQTN